MVASWEKGNCSTPCFSLYGLQTPDLEKADRCRFLRLKKGLPSGKSFSGERSRKPSLALQPQPMDEFTSKLDSFVGQEKVRAPVVHLWDS